MIQITLPWPSSDLHAHASGFRGSQWKKIRATKEARQTAFILAKKSMVESDWKAPERAYIAYRFYEPDHRQRDQGNLIQMCKAFCDGIVDAGVIYGDHSSVLQIVGCVSDWSDKKNPRVVITLNEAP